MIKNFFSLYAPDLSDGWEKNLIMHLGSDKNAKRKLEERGGEIKVGFLKGSTWKYEVGCQ